jgi:hypothetical protein
VKRLPSNIEELLTPLAIAHIIISIPLLLKDSYLNKTSFMFSPLCTPKKYLRLASPRFINNVAATPRPLRVTCSRFIHNVAGPLVGVSNAPIFSTIVYDDADANKLQAIK